MDIKTFKGGAFIPHYKSFTESKSIEKFAVPDKVIIPLFQHIGKACEPTVNVGDIVSIGDKIGDSDEFISASVHSSVSGKVVAIEPKPYCSGVEANSVVIETDFSKPQEFEYSNKRSTENMSREEILEHIKEAGIVGMGGASFPTHVNINQKKSIDNLLINGAECEPFLTCDHRQMVEKADELIEGAKLIMKVIGAKNCFIGIEVNKPDAIEVLQSKTKNLEGFEVVPLEAKYPQGFKSHLIKAITGRDVPRGARSADTGCIVRNVGTTIAVYEAVVYSKPLIERIVTVSGQDVPNYGNYLIKIGTPLNFILSKSGVKNFDGSKIVIGGPMTGLAQFNLEVPVIKNTTGILFLPREMVKDQKTYEDCVRCGKCVEHCPIYLYPNQLSLYAEADMPEEADEWNVMDCIECGICSFFCISNRPIVEMIQNIKPVVKELQK